jgi:hypothetical protein
MVSDVKSLEFSKTFFTTWFAKETPEIGFGNGPISSILFIYFVVSNFLVSEKL